MNDTVATHVLYQLERIATALEKIEEKLPHPAQTPVEFNLGERCGVMVDGRPCGYHEDHIGACEGA